MLDGNKELVEVSPGAVAVDLSARTALSNANLFMIGVDSQRGTAQTTQYVSYFGQGSLLRFGILLLRPTCRIRFRKSAEIVALCSTASILHLPTFSRSIRLTYQAR